MGPLQGMGQYAMTPYVLLITYAMFSKSIPFHSWLDCRTTAQLAVAYASYNITATCIRVKDKKVLFQTRKG